MPQVAAAGAGLVVSLSAAALAEGLSRALDDEAWRRRAAIAGRALVREHYTWPAIARTTLEAYERAIAQLGQAGFRST